MPLIHIKKKELLKNVWSGGTTTQLFIYPKESLYKKLDFIFRISTATIDVEQSTFTSLPEVNRILMVLNGELTIHHKNQYSKHLKKFDVDTFNGNWHTTSIGKATDFNLMLRNNASGSIKGIAFQPNEKKEINFNSDFLLLYICSGKIEVENSIINQGDVLIFERENFLIQALSPSDAALATIKL